MRINHSFCLYITVSMCTIITVKQTHHVTNTHVGNHFYPVRACAARGRVIVLSVCLSVCLFVCLSAPTQDFEQNRLVYRLYLLRMSQKLKHINLYLPHERERTSGSQEKQTIHIFWALLKLPFKSGDLFTTTIITIAQAHNQAIVLAYAFAC